MLKNLKFILLLMTVLISACSSDVSNKFVKNEAKSQSVDKYQAIFNKMVYEILLHKGKIDDALEIFISNIYLFKDEGEFFRMINHSRDLRDFHSIELILERWFVLDADNISAHKIAFANNLELENYKLAEYHLVYLLSRYDTNKNKSYIDVDEILADSLYTSNAVKFFKTFFLKNSNEDLFMSYVDFLQRKDLNSIVVTYSDQFNKDNRIQIRKLAYSLSKINQSKNAIEMMEDYIERSSVTDRQVSLELVSLYLSSNEMSKATSLIEKIINIDQSDDNFIYRVALTCYSQKKYDLSEKYFNILLSKSYVPDDINFFLGQIDYENGRYNEAILHFNRVEQGSFLSSKFSSIALSLLKESGITVAIDYIEDNYNRYSNQNQTNLISLKILLYEELSNYNEVITLANKGLEIDPDNNRLLYSRALAYEKIGDINKMSEDFERMISMDPHNSIALNALGYSLTLHTKNYDYAEKLIRRANKIDPGNAAIIDSLAWVLYKKGYFKEAIKYSSLAYIKDQDPEIIEHHYFILLENNKKTEAQKVLSESIKTNPNNKSLLDLYNKSKYNETSL